MIALCDARIGDTVLYENEGWILDFVCGCIEKAYDVAQTWYNDGWDTRIVEIPTTRSNPQIAVLRRMDTL